MHIDVAKTIATILASSRLDYCNLLYHNIALNDILTLQRVQHCLTRVVTKNVFVKCDTSPQIIGIGIGSVYLTHRLNNTVVNTMKIYSSNNVLINNK